jgi:hypothetical protein
MDYSPSGNRNLENLQKWLDYELPASALGFFSWFYGILLAVAMLAAIVFIPFMLRILYVEKKIGWIIYFIIIVVIPAVLIYFLNKGNPYGFLLQILPLGLFFFYCFNLKLAVRGWVVKEKFLLNKDIKPINIDDVFRNYKF